MTLLGRFWKIVRGLLWELSDQSAYQRHLAYHGVPHSREEWQRFSDAKLRQKYQNGKCC